MRSIQSRNETFSRQSFDLNKICKTLKYLYEIIKKWISLILFSIIWYVTDIKHKDEMIFFYNFYYTMLNSQTCIYMMVCFFVLFHMSFYDKRWPLAERKKKFYLFTASFQHRQRMTPHKQQKYSTFLFLPRFF